MHIFASCAITGNARWGGTYSETSKYVSRQMNMTWASIIEHEHAHLHLRKIFVYLYLKVLIVKKKVTAAVLSCGGIL